MTLEKVRVEYSPLSQRIHMHRMGKSKVDSLESKEVTSQVFAAVVDQLMDGRPAGGSTVITNRVSGEKYKVTIVPVLAEEPC